MTLSVSPETVNVTRGRLGRTTEIVGGAREPHSYVLVTLPRLPGFFKNRKSSLWTTNPRLIGIPSAMPFFTTKNQTTLHYAENGKSDGKLIICLHGLGGSIETFSSLLPSLESTYRIVRMDFEGLGESPLTSRSLSIARYASDLSDLISYIQRNGHSSSPVILIGHSLGSVVALHFAASAPKVVDGLILLGVGRSASHIQAVRERMLDMAAKTRKQGIDFAADLAATSNFPLDSERQVDVEARDFVRRQVAGSDPEGYAKTCEAVVDLDHKDPDYSKIVCKSLLIAGDMDVISPVSRAEELKSLLGGESQLTIVKSGHQPILEDLKAVEASLIPFLTSLLSSLVV